jgi:hypothetical protein
VREGREEEGMVKDCRLGKTGDRLERESNVFILSLISYNLSLFRLKLGDTAVCFGKGMYRLIPFGGYGLYVRFLFSLLGFRFRAYPQKGDGLTLGKGHFMGNFYAADFKCNSLRNSLNNGNRQQRNILKEFFNKSGLFLFKPVIAISYSMFYKIQESGNQ